MVCTRNIFKKNLKKNVSCQPVFVVAVQTKNKKQYLRHRMKINKFLVFNTILLPFDQEFLLTCDSIFKRIILKNAFSPYLNEKVGSIFSRTDFSSHSLSVCSTLQNVLYQTPIISLAQIIDHRSPTNSRPAYP